MLVKRLIDYACLSSLKGIVSSMWLKILFDHNFLSSRKGILACGRRSSPFMLPCILKLPHSACRMGSKRIFAHDFSP